jgi:hypothetical protein
VHKFSFNFETISDERRNALMEAMLFLFDSAMRGDDKATVSYENSVKAGNWKEKFAKSYTWGMGEGAPSLRSFGIWFIQRNLFDEHYVGAPTTEAAADQPQPIGIFNADGTSNLPTPTDDGGDLPPDGEAIATDGGEPDPLEKFRLFINGLAELDKPAEAAAEQEQVDQVGEADTENPTPTGECLTCRRPCYGNEMYCGGDACTFGATEQPPAEGSAE